MCAEAKKPSKRKTVKKTVSTSKAPKTTVTPKTPKKRSSTTGPVTKRTDTPETPVTAEVATKQAIEASPKSTIKKRKSVAVSKKPSAKKDSGKKKTTKRTKKTSSRTPMSEGKRRGVLIAMAVVVVAALLVGVDCARTFHRIHPGISIGEVEVGGMTIDEAAIAIEDYYVPILNDAEVVIFADEAAQQAFDPEVGFVAAEPGTTASSWEVTVNTIGGRIDGKGLATIAYEATRGEGGFSNRMRSIFGGIDLPVFVSSDYHAFYALKATIDEVLGTQPVDAGLSIVDGIVSTTAPFDGYLVNAKSLLDGISEGLLSDGGNFIAPMETVHYTFGTPEAEVVAQEVRDAIAADVTATYGENTWTLGPVEMGYMVNTWVETPATNPILHPGISAAWADNEMRYVMGDAAATVGASDAYFDTSQGYVNIIPSSNGIGPDFNTFSNDLYNILFGSGGERSIVINETEAEPNITTEEAEAMGITECIGSFSMSNASAYEEKLFNMHLACNTINYCFVAPGETWSWNEYVGDTTADKGYLEGHTVMDGEIQSSIGGGICQVATTMFNAVYEAGLEINERHNHSMYFAEYPEGRDATISYGNYDLKWTNNTDHWILIEMYSNPDGGSIYCQLWGSPTGRTVTTDYGPWYEGSSYTTKEVYDGSLPSGTRYVEQPGENGKSITVWRHVYDAEGNEIDYNEFSSYYNPTTEVIRVGTGA